MSDQNDPPHTAAEELTTPTLKLWTSMESFNGSLPAHNNEHDARSSSPHNGNNNSNLGTPRPAEMHQTGSSVQAHGSNDRHGSYGLSPIDLQDSLSPISSSHAIYNDSDEFTTPNFDDQILDFEEVLNLNGTTTTTQEEGAVPDSESQAQPFGNDQRHGVDPGNRALMNNEDIPSLQDQENLRKLEEENSKVETWLTRSTSNDEADVEVDPGVSEGTGIDRHPDNFLEEPSRQNPAMKREVDPFPPMPHPRVNKPQKYVDVDEDEEEYDDDGNSSDSSSEAGPPSDVEKYRLEDEQAQDQINQIQTSKGFKVRPWTDSPVDQDLPNANGQPPSSNAAIAQFLQKARDVETASFTATLGSRRRSEADMDSLFSAAGISVRTTQVQEPEQKEKERPSTLLGRIRRSSSNVRKRKDDQSGQKDGSTSASQRREQQGSLSSVRSVKNLGAWPRPRSPQIDTDLQQSPRPMVQSPTSTSSIWQSGRNVGRNVIRRARSKSDLNRNNGTVGLAEKWAQQGGPPVPSLKPPSTEVEELEALQQQDHHQQQQQESGDNEEISPSNTHSMPLKIQDVPRAPTSDGFRNHVCKLNPNLDEYMIQRVLIEQLKRYKRLVEARKTHERLIKSKKCPSGARCPLNGEGPRYISGKNEKGSDGGAVTFHIALPDGSSVNGPSPENGQSSLAIFPEGIPLPPAKSLPAQFECPLCFQVKKFSKPSDWTKHVHEDVQPFTCSFPNCGEPKSFKRKADWVRHENERHRQLEKWICSIDECNHTCYRRDNFVQHLVREHKLAEPRTRPTKTPNKNTGRGVEDGEATARLVDDCHHETTRKTSEEACRFCGYFCTTWKKLTVHLAKHMEQIAMPILDMLDQDYTVDIPHPTTTGLDTSSHMTPAPQLNDMSRTVSGSPLSAVASVYGHSTPPNVLASGSLSGSTYPPAGVSRSSYNPGARVFTQAATHLNENAHSPVPAYPASELSAMRSALPQNTGNTTTSYGSNTLGVPAHSYAQNTMTTGQQRTPSPATYPPAWYGTSLAPSQSPTALAQAPNYTASPTEVAPYNPLNAPEANGGDNGLEDRHYSPANSFQPAGPYYMNQEGHFEDHATSQTYNNPQDSGLTGMYPHTNPGFNTDWQCMAASQGYNGYHGGSTHAQ